jgi:hypothetical protein
MDDGLRMVETRACGAWVLPGDPTCAGIARRLFHRVAAEFALDRETIEDGVTMVSELAANTLHASQRQLLPSSPELWLYLRGTGQRSELVCKVFDTLPGWICGVPGRNDRRAPVDATSGRGLEVVHELSAGRWGHHLTRSRLSGSGTRGKAVWFAVPAPAIAPLAGGRPPATAAAAMSELEQDLGTRGFSGRLIRADDPAADMAVLSIASGLTVWCRSAAAWLWAPGVAAQQWSYCDLVEVAEQAVQAHEVSLAAAGLLPLVAASRTGSLTPRTPRFRYGPLARRRRPAQSRATGSRPYASRTVAQKRSASTAVATCALPRPGSVNSVTVMPEVSLPCVSTCTRAGV